MRLRRVLFLLAAAEIGGCRSPAPPPTIPALASDPPEAEPAEVVPAGEAWLATATPVRLADGRLLLLGGGTDRAALWDGVHLVALAPMPRPRQRAGQAPPTTSTLPSSSRGAVAPSRTSGRVTPPR